MTNQFSFTSAFTAAAVFSLSAYFGILALATVQTGPTVFTFLFGFIAIMLVCGGLQVLLWEVVDQIVTRLK